MNTSKIMKAAWIIARDGATKFGGSAKSYFAAALRMAWADASRRRLVRVLDDAASNAGDFGATSKQTWFLAGRMISACEDEYSLNSSFDTFRPVLTKKQASAYIDQILSEKTRKAA